jgi:hypothetical protein
MLALRRVTDREEALLDQGRQQENQQLLPGFSWLLSANRRLSKSSPLERAGLVHDWRAPSEMNDGIGMNENKLCLAIWYVHAGAGNIENRTL